MLIESVTVRRAEFPLYEPYELAFGNTESYQSVVVEVTTDTGKKGLCEAIIITGYTPETVEKAYRTLTGLGPRLVGLPVDAIADTAAPLHGEVPFGASALIIATEIASGMPELSPDRAIRCPILALVKNKEPAALDIEIEDLIAAGYRVLKVKVGFDLETDLRKVSEVQARVRGRAKIRVDANQGFSQEEACSFVSRLDPSDIELVEQTCAADDWEAAVAVSRVSEVPLMLDESIYDCSDIDRAAELGCARYIKTKALKAGGVRETQKTISKIREHGMIPVLGNGAAMDLTCWVEAAIAGDAFETHGEMNGFLKTPVQLLDGQLKLDKGSIVIGPGPLKIREDLIERYTIEKTDYGR